MVGIHVGGEDHQHLEGDLDLHPTGEGKEVNAAIQRHDPAVQQFFGTDALAAEIVDDEDAVVGLELHGADIEAADRVELQVEHLDGQLSADLDGGAVAADPRSSQLRKAGRSTGTWTVGSKTVMVWPSTSMA